uniref:Ion transport domain-containing protein n=1 Tax=Eptatretus burgeri TaxID=7764 RepID=A0A8C4NJ13_EPTBU
MNNLFLLKQSIHLCFSFTHLYSLLTHYVSVITAELGDHHELNHNLSAVLPNADIQDPWLLRPHHWRHRLWLLLEQPTSSPIAHAVAIFAILPALLSLLAGAMETVTHEDEGDEYIWSNIEGACVLYFTAELVLRWFATPSLAVFVRLKHVILDLMLLLAYYVHLILHWWSNSVHGKTQGHGYKVLHQLHSSLRLLDLLRVCRVLRMVRHTISIWALMFTLRQCLQKLGILWLLLMTFGVFGFAPLVYIVELDHPESNLTNIPVANWWAMVSQLINVYCTRPRFGEGALTKFREN